MKKFASVIIFALILGSILQIRLVKADSMIYIEADGSIVPSTAPIERNGNVYSFTDTIFNQTIVVRRSNIVIDGAGFKLEGHRKHHPGSSATERGLYLIGVRNVTIQNMELQTFQFGIYINYSSNCLIVNNMLINSSLGFSHSSNNVMSNNTVHGTVEIYLSYNNTFTENRIYDGYFYRRSDYGQPPTNMKDFTNSIDTSNQVNDAPVYNLVNQTNLTIDSNTTSQIGGLILANCDNVTIKDITIMQGSPSVLFVNTTNSALINCTVIDYRDRHGILLSNSKNNLISNNNITSIYGNNQVYGIGSKSSSNNTISDNFVLGYWWIGIKTGSYDVISGNIVTQAARGLFIGGNGCKVFDNEVYSTMWHPSRGPVADSGTGMQVGGGGHQIFRNTFRNNGQAIVGFGSNSTYYLNNFINNSKTVDVQNREIRNWDNGTIGNYWDGYQGEDLNSDGIGDTPYIIDENNQDNYPLMNPTGFSKIPETTPLTISIVSPENKTYSTTNIPLNFTVNEPVSQITYSLDGQDNVTINGNTTLTDLPDGPHSLIVYATDTTGNTGASETIYFSIEVPPPEPVPLTWIAAATATIAIVGAILLVYFKKTKRH